MFLDYEDKNFIIKLNETRKKYLFLIINIKLIEQFFVFIFHKNHKNAYKRNGIHQNIYHQLQTQHVQSIFKLRSCTFCLIELENVLEVLILNSFI